MTVITVMTTLLVIFLGGIVASLFAKYLKLPLTLCILICGVIAGILVPVLQLDTGLRASNFQPLVFYVLLPVLVFEAALNIQLTILKPVLKTVLFSATVGVVVAMLVTGLSIYYAFNAHPGFPIIAGLLTGIVVAATDPVAVVGQLKTANAPKKLAALIEGESLFNDATAIVLFGVLLIIATGSDTVTYMGAGLTFIKVLIGGVIIGALCGVIINGLLRLLADDCSVFILLSLTLAYGSFYIAEHLFHVSGVIATLVAALIAQKAFLAHSHFQQSMHKSWELIAYIANLAVFFLLGLTVTLDMFASHWLAMLVGIVAALIARILSSYLAIAVGKYIFNDELDWRYAPVMVWGGLRGVVTIALVLSLPTELAYWYTIQSIAFAVVLFTLVVQATTNPWLLRKLALTEA